MAMGGHTSGKVVTLDGDKLGHVAGGIAAVAVMAWQALYRDAGPGTMLVRGGWAFVGVYAAAFFFTRVLLRETIKQVVVEKRERREERRRRQQEARQKAASVFGDTPALAEPVEPTEPAPEPEA